MLDTLPPMQIDIQLMFQRRVRGVFVLYWISSVVIFLFLECAGTENAGQDGPTRPTSGWWPAPCLQPTW